MQVISDLDSTHPAFPICFSELRGICGTWGQLPASCTISDILLDTGDKPFASEALADMCEGTLNGSRVCVRKVRMYSGEDPQKVKRVCYITHSFPRSHFLNVRQIFYWVAVTWKHLNHPNIVPFLGATLDPPQLVSAWMSGGSLREYINEHPGKNRLVLVGFRPTVSVFVLTSSSAT